MQVSSIKFSKLHTAILAVFISIMTFFGLASLAYAQGSIADNVCKGVIGTETSNVNSGTTISSCQENGDQSFNGIAKRVINIFSIVVGAVSVIMIIIGGFRYIISGGDSAGVTGAKNTILYAIVGLVIVLFSQIIIRFVLSTATKAT